MPLYLERLCVSLRRVSSVSKNYQKFFASIPVALLFAAAPVSADRLPLSVTPSDTETAINFVLRTDSPMVILSNKTLSIILPGESVAQRIEREKAEAEAKAKEAAKRNTISREYRAPVVKYTDPADFNTIYARAGAAFDVSPALLKAIHTVETGASGSTMRANPSGATGPMQFLPSTFRRHGVDGNGDGIKDISNVEDAIFSAANYLRACGYPDIKKALWGYNPSTRYYNKVMKLAQSFGL